MEQGVPSTSSQKRGWLWEEETPEGSGKIAL